MIEVSSGFQYLFIPAVNIAVHGGLNVRMTCNGLYGFDVCAGFSQHGQIGMSEDMRRRAMQIDGLANSFPCAVEHTLCDRLFPSAYDIACTAVQKRFSGSQTHKFLCSIRLIEVS